MIKKALLHMFDQPALRHKCLCQYPIKMFGRKTVCPAGIVHLVSACTTRHQLSVCSLDLVALRRHAPEPSSFSHPPRPPKGIGSQICLAPTQLVHLASGGLRIAPEAFAWWPCSMRSHRAYLCKSAHTLQVHDCRVRWDEVNL